jgi:hypothetical protein
LAERWKNRARRASFAETTIPPEKNIRVKVVLKLDMTQTVMVLAATDELLIFLAEKSSLRREAGYPLWVKA